jgi:hypothetical protein
LLSKLFLAILLLVLASKLGLGIKLRQLRPRIDRAVNITIAVLVVAYVGQLLWLFVQKHAAR